MKKVCIGCGRNRRIGKFGQQSRMPDGKNPYCRDCMRAYNKNYRDSIRGRAKLNKAKKKYRRKNKGRISDYNRLYYQRKKHIILYNKKCREDTECVMIFDEKNSDNGRKKKKNKINSSGKKYKIIKIDPKRK